MKPATSCGVFFGGAMAYAGEGDQLGVVQVTRGASAAEWMGTARSQSPQRTRLGVSRGRRRARRRPDMSLCQVWRRRSRCEDGAGGAEVVAIGLEALGSVPALGAGHAAEADHLQPLG